MSNIEEITNKFTSVSLLDIGENSLLDRTDTKFIFHQNQVADLLTEIMPHFQILEIENRRIFSYETLYFDTPDHYFYFQHHNKLLNRYKIRYRRYADTDDVFLEIKLKSNKKRTVKTRVSKPMISHSLSPEDMEMIHQETNNLELNLSPCLWVYYTRISLISPDFSERVSIDVNLAFSNSQNGTEIRTNVENLAIAELKQAKKSFNSPFRMAVRKFKLRSISFSKYCFGTALLHPEMKQNNFKRTFSAVNKITYGSV